MEPDPATQHGKERHMADGTPLKLNGTAIILLYPRRFARRRVTSRVRRRTSFCPTAI